MPIFSFYKSVQSNSLSRNVSHNFVVESSKLSPIASVFPRFDLGAPSASPSTSTTLPSFFPPLCVSWPESVHVPQLSPSPSQGSPLRRLFLLNFQLFRPSLLLEWKGARFLPQILTQFRS